jgi:hypothetical protein
MSTQLKTGGLLFGSRIRSPLIGIDVDQCDNQVSDIGNSDGNGSTLQIGLRETYLSGEMSNIDSYRRDLAFFRQLTNSRTAAAASRLSFAGAMFARTGSHCNCVHFTVPVTYEERCSSAHRFCWYAHYSTILEFSAVE